ncbi:MAG: GatB/YqeY domain-containing protein [Mangrovibacterium sp.]
MKLFDQINEDLKSAMKAREKEKLEAIRNIKKVLLEAKAAKGADSELDDQEVMKVISKLAKQGQDSANIYKEQARPDLYEAEMAQVTVYEQYLPKKLGDEELTAAIQEIIASVGAAGMKDMGKVMGIASKKLAGKAEGKDIADKVKSLLN